MEEIDQTKKASEAPCPAGGHKEKKVTIVYSAHATSEDADSPWYAAIEVTKDFIDALNGLHQIIKTNDLTEVRKFGAPDWGPSGEEMRLRGHEVVVTSNGHCYYTAFPKYGAPVESTLTSMQELANRFEQASDGEAIDCTDDETIFQQYQADQEAPAQAQAAPATT